jgi:molybdopterin-containing oxidoreductase family membrane subunit
VGTLGLFFTLFLLFAKYFPVVNMFEVKAILKSSSGVKHSHTPETMHAHSTNNQAHHDK